MGVQRMNDPFELFFCEYSSSQNSFHVNTLREMLISNLRAVINGKPLNYAPFYITDNRKKADDLCSQMRKIIDGRGTA